MKEYTVKEFGKRVSAILTEAETENVVIKRRNGMEFVITARSVPQEVEVSTSMIRTASEVSTSKSKVAKALERLEAGEVCRHRLAYCPQCHGH